MARTPPYRGRDDGGATSVIVFEENKGTKTSTFLGRSIQRIRFRTGISEASARYVQYGGRYLLIFPGVEFPLLCRLVVLRQDTIRMPDGELVDRSKPLEDWFGFVREQLGP